MFSMKTEGKEVEGCGAGECGGLSLQSASVFFIKEEIIKEYPKERAKTQKGPERVKKS